MEVMERILLSPITSQNHLIAATVNPCTAFAGSPALGEQSSAEWVRIVFHDFITADVAAGTGFVSLPLLLVLLSDGTSGLDASISFESDRAENVGLHFINDTIGIVS
jgi:hypothetical protein